MEPEQAIKLFVGGVSHDTNEQTLRDYFSKYGEVKSSEILRDRITGVARGFGFIVFADSSVVDQVLNDNHVILGKKVEVKVARPKGFREPSIETGESLNYGKNRKIFVGGIPADLTTEELKTHFENYGSVTVAEIRHPRGFGFVTFDSEDAAESALKTPFQYLKNKRVEVKVAEAKAKVGFCGFNGVRDYTTCGNCGASMASSIFPTNGAYIPCAYGYGYMPAQWYYYGTTLNEWHGGFSYSSCFSHYNHSDQRSIFVGQSPRRYSPPVIIHPPPERVGQNENGNAVAEENQLAVLENNSEEDGNDCNSEVQSQDEVEVDGDIPTKKAVIAEL